VTRTFYRNSSAVVIMYDITKYYTFEDVDYWLNETRQHSDSDALVYLVGNMIDLEPKREVKRIEAETYADRKGFHGFYEVSAKSGENVNQ
jgi:Ras-related protein Rab-2A